MKALSQIHLWCWPCRSFRGRDQSGSGSVAYKLYEFSIIPDRGIRVGDLSSQLTTKNQKLEAIDIDHRLTKQQYTNLFPLNGTMCGRKTSCMACQQKQLYESEGAHRNLINQIEETWGRWYVLCSWGHQMVHKVMTSIGSKR